MRIIVAKYICIVSILLLAKFSFSQEDLTYTIGRGFLLPSGYTMSPYLVEDEDHFYTLRISNKECFDCKSGTTDAFFEKFDKNLNHVESIPIVLTLSDQYKKPRPKDIYLMDNQFFIFAEELNVSTQTAKSILFIVDRKGHQVGDALILGEVGNIDKGSEGTSEEALEGVFSFELFDYENKSRFLYIQYFPNENSMDTRINIKVFDSGATQLWEKHLVLPFDPFFSEMSRIILYGQELFLIMTLRNPYEGINNYKIVTYNHSKDETSHYNFILENIKINSLEVGQVEAGNIYIYGLYSDLGSKNEVDGLFFYLFNELNKEILTYATTAINVDKIKSITDDDLKNLHAREIYLKNNGDVVFIAELEWTEIMTIQDSESKYYFKPYYHSNEILIMCFDPGGQLKWETWFPKLQYRPDNLMMGYASIFRDNKMYILFNDHPKNLRIYDPDDMKQMKNKFILSLGEIDLDNGKIQKSHYKFIREQKEEVIFRKDYTYKIGNHSLVILEESETVRLIQFNF